MRVMCSSTILGAPPTIPRTSNRTAPCVPASNAPIDAVVTADSSGRRSTCSRMPSRSAPSALAISRTWPPHTMVGTVGASIGGSYSIGWPMPTR
jgi:hypothetical protein